MRWRQVAVFGLAVLVAACSSNSSKELPPNPLPKFEPEVQLDSRWSRSIGNGQGDLYNLLAPASDGDRLYAVAANGKLQAFDRLSGERLWAVDLDRQVSGGVGAGYGLVLVGTLKGEVIALDATSGETRWVARVTSEVLSAPATNGELVVVQTQDDRLIAFDAASGSQRWIYESSPAVLTLRGTSSPQMTSRLVIAGLSSGKLLALDAGRGVPVWEQRVAVSQGRSELERMVDIDGNLLLTGGVVYAVSYQGKVAAFDAESGRPLWDRDASSYAGIAQGFGSLYVSQASGVLEGIDERSNSILWSNDELLRRKLSAPEVFSSYVAVGDLDGYLHLLSQVDGHFVGRRKIDGSGLRVRPLVIGEWIYVYTNSGKLVGLTLR